MPYELLKRVDVEFLHPGFRDRLLQMLAACLKAGFDYWAISGYRSAREQQELYNEGRLKPGPVVTNARPFQSAHNFGIAVDFARDSDTTRAGLQPGWDTGDYEELGKQARLHGLVWGGDFKLKDHPHVQLPGYVTAAELEPLRVAYLAAPRWGSDQRSWELSKLQVAWRQLDARPIFHPASHAS